MRMVARTSLGLGMVDVSACTRAMDARHIREQLRLLDNMAANNFDLKEGVREKLLAKLKGLES